MCRFWARVLEDVEVIRQAQALTMAALCHGRSIRTKPNRLQGLRVEAPPLENVVEHVVECGPWITEPPRRW